MEQFSAFLVNKKETKTEKETETDKDIGSGQSPRTVRINRIFLATEGEGVHLGTPQVFIRLQGCQVGCLNCDTKESWSAHPRFEWPIEKVLARAQELAGQNVKRVSITGGEPLEQAAATLVLVRALKELGMFVNIEVSGQKICHDIFSLADFIGFDVKTPSTGVPERADLICEMVRSYPEKIQIKSVIASMQDFRWCRDLRERLMGDDGGVGPELAHVPWVLTPCYEPKDRVAPLDLFQAIMVNNQELGGMFRVILQQHKWVYGPVTPGV